MRRRREAPAFGGAADSSAAVAWGGRLKIVPLLGRVRTAPIRIGSSRAAAARQMPGVPAQMRGRRAGWVPLSGLADRRRLRAPPLRRQRPHKTRGRVASWGASSARRCPLRLRLGGFSGIPRAAALSGRRCRPACSVAPPFCARPRCGSASLSAGAPASPAPRASPPRAGRCGGPGAPRSCLSPAAAPGPLTPAPAVWPSGLGCARGPGRLRPTGAKSRPSLLPRGLPGPQGWRGRGRAIRARPHTCARAIETLRASPVVAPGPLLGGGRARGRPGGRTRPGAFWRLRAAPAPCAGDEGRGTGGAAHGGAEYHKPPAVCVKGLSRHKAPQAVFIPRSP